MDPGEIGAEISALASDYAAASDHEVMASARAQLLGRLEKLHLPTLEMTTERIDPTRLRADATLRGSIRVHLDLAFRSPIEPGNLLSAATRGICRVAWHPHLVGFPVGVALALPAARLPRACLELFVDDSVTLAGAPFVILHALATNPGRLGAASQLIRSVRGDCALFSPRPRLVAFSPLTGLRARVIALIEREGWADDAESAELLVTQVAEALNGERPPQSMAEPLTSWLAEQASQYAHSSAYVVGRFHRSQGAALIGVAHLADAEDASALWARGLFDYRS